MSYPGSKGQAGTWQHIIGQMPPHALYVEPFAGSAQVFFRKRPASRSVLIDADDRTASALTIAAGNAKAGAGGRTALVDVIHGDGLAWLKASTFDLDSSAVVYCDPPYLLSTRKSRRYYRHEFTDDHHRALLSTLADIKCKVLLSGYPSELYSWQLRGWRCCSYRTRTRGATVTECLWMNFPEPTELHDWRYAGRSYRERLTFKRLAARWLARLDRMPARKRGFILDGIRQRYP